VIINRLFSETDLINPVDFRMGLNIVLGSYSNNNYKRNLNGVGKSSLVRLIAYLLLSDSAEQTFKKREYEFLRKENHSISIEFKIKEQIYILNRQFSSENDISFGERGQTLNIYTKPEIKTILQRKIFPIEQENIIYEGNTFGALLDFFMRDDMKNLQRYEPLIFSKFLTKKAEQSILNFFLLGLQTNSLIDFNRILDEQKKYNTTIETVSKSVKEETGKTIEEFKTEKIKIEENINRIEASIKNYTFLENYKIIENDLIKVSAEINNELKEYNVLDKKLAKLKKSYQFNQNEDINTQEIKNLYDEILATFGQLVSKKLSDIMEFKKEILDNRNKLLVEREKKLQEAINAILKKISDLERRRSELYRFLEEKEALDSIKNAYEELTKEKTILSGNMQRIKEIEDYKEKMSVNQVSISELQLKIQNMLRDNGTYIDEFRKLFLDILENAISFDSNVEGHFDIAIKDRISKDKMPFEIKISIPKADSLGMSRLKIFVYDLMIFLKNIYTQRALPCFLIHDGVFWGISRETVIKSLNYINRKCLENPNFQYIATFNETEIDANALDFNLQDTIIAKYSDNPKNMIFKREFL